MGLSYSKTTLEKPILDSYNGKAFWKRVFLKPPQKNVSQDDAEVLAKLPAWKRYLLLAPPGKVEDHNAEAKDMIPDTFEGFRMEFNRIFGEPSDNSDDDDEDDTNHNESKSKNASSKGGNENLRKSVLSQWFSSPRLFVTNIMKVAPPPPQLSQYYPPGVKNEDYMMAAQFVAGPLSFMGRMDKSLSVFGTASISLAQRFKLLLQGQSQHKKGIPMNYAAEVKASLGPSTTHLKIQSAEQAFSVGHMQRITRNFSLGSEALFLLKRNLRCVSVAGRWLVAQGSGVLAGVFMDKPRGLDLSYTQRISRYLKVSTELSVGRNEKKKGALETNVAGGWEYKVSDTVVKGRLSSDLTLETSVEESLGDMCNVSLSAVMNIPEHTYNWGFGLQFNS